MAGVEPVWRDFVMRHVKFIPAPATAAVISADAAAVETQPNQRLTR